MSHLWTCDAMFMFFRKANKSLTFAAFIREYNFYIGIKFIRVNKNNQSLCQYFVYFQLLKRAEQLMVLCCVHTTLWLSAVSCSVHFSQ